MENTNEQQPGKIARLKRFIYECKIAIRVTKKPEKEEFKAVVKAAGIGILVIGAMGFLIQMIKYYLFG